jgi:hypothetical protein
MGLDMLKFIGAAQKLGDAINNAIGTHGREYLISKYRNGGLHLKIILEDIDIQVHLRPVEKPSYITQGE